MASKAKLMEDNALTEQQKAQAARYAAEQAAVQKQNMFTSAQDQLKKQGIQQYFLYS